MVRFDAEALRADPAKIALGGCSGGVDEAVNTRERESPSCQAALASHRMALMFQVLFTSLVLAVCVAAAAALIYAIANGLNKGVDLTVLLTGISGAAGSGATIFLGKKAKESVNVAKEALADVEKYCGTEVKKEVG